jgi:hypothetical protein
MPVLIHKIGNGNIVEFDTGKFDGWCVYLKRPHQERYAPKDTEYFGMMANLGKKYGFLKVYDDFVSIYHATHKQLDNDVLKLISDLSKAYKEDTEETEIWFTILYAGMIAEENKEHAILGKKIKRLGMYQVLIEKMSPLEAAVFSKGKKWKDWKK